MAAEEKKSGGRKKASLIDPLYQKFTKSVIRALGSTDFYEFFMDAVSRAENEIQFSNRKLEKTVDVTWVDNIDETLTAFQTIISNPRNVIHEEELIVNVAHAKKGGADVVRHLSQHASLVDKFDEPTGEVRPNKLMQKFREDSIGIYENRLVFTTMENAYQFVKIRHDALFSAMSDEFGAKLKVDSTMQSATEMVHMDLFLHIKEIESTLDTEDKNRDVFAQISRIYRVLSVMMNSQFAQQLSRLPRVKGSIVKTNVLKKNPNYRKILNLFSFLHEYDEIGYTIRVVEQNPEVTEEFQRDIFHNVLFNYLILKGYLEDEKDRRIPTPAKTKQRALKPKFIKEIIEELTEDYDLPDVEIRKVLIEELTKEQLMHEEAEERRRLVEEQAKRKKEEQERIRKEKEAEKERIRQEKEAEEERLRLERMERETEDRRRSKLLKIELARFEEMLPKQLEAREAAAAKKIAELKEFEDAAQLLEEAEQRRLEAEERERRRIQEEKERIRREKQLAILKAKEEEQRRLEEAQREQDARDTAGTEPFRQEITIFLDALQQRLALREEEKQRIQQRQQMLEEQRKQRLTARGLFGIRKQ